MRNLLLSGGPGHDFDLTSAALAKILASPDIATEIVTDPAHFFDLLRLGTNGQIEPWDLLTVNALRWQMGQDRYAEQRTEWEYAIQENDLGLITEFVNSGGGLLALHTAVICFDAHPLWQQLTGASWNFSTSSHPPVGEFEVSVTQDGLKHPLTAATENFSIADELYGFLDQVPGLAPLLTARYLDRDQPLLWARSLGKGRVVTDLLGHSVESLSNATHQGILVRAAHWAAGESEPLQSHSVGST